MIFLFTVVILVVSLVNLDRFDLDHYSTWLWIILYMAIPANAGYYMWLPIATVHGVGYSRFVFGR